MSCAHEIAELIPWYAAGTLHSDDQKLVEEHLGECADCRESLTLAREVVAGDTLPPGALSEHVHAELLTEYAQRPAALEPDLVRRIEHHLSSCELCTEVAAIVRELPSAEDETAPSVLERAWGFLASTVLQPAPALAYLVLLAISLPVYRSLAPRADRATPVESVAPSDVTGALQITFLERASRGVAETQKIGVPAGSSVVYLGIEPSLPDGLPDDRVCRIEILSDGTASWSHELTAAEIRSALAADQVAVILAVPATALRPGPYLLRVTAAGERQPVLESPFETADALPFPVHLGNQ